MIRIVYIAFLVIVCVVTAGCKRHSDVDDVAPWLDRMKSTHATADRLLAENDIDQARDVLTASWNAEAPAGIAVADGRAIRQDVAYRLAELELAAEHTDAVMMWADRGLALGHDETVMTANLLMLRGRLFERLGQPTKAVADLHDALLINEKLLARTLENP
jgi:hypothetical protein